MQEEAFWRQVDRSAGSDGCWPWRGARHRQRGSYGAVRWDGEVVAAHRVAFMLTKRPLAVGEHVRHTCDNPPCCNPAHLLAGSQEDNWADARERSRLGRREVRFNDAEIVAIREARARGELTRTLAERYGVSRSLISLIVNRKAYRRVPESDEG